MNARGIVIATIWAGTLAFFGYLLVITIPLVAPKVSFDAVKHIVENGRIAIVAFFGFLGAAIGLLHQLGVKPTDMESEAGVSPDERVADPTVETYKAKLTQTYNAALKLKSIARHNRHVGIKAMSYRVAMNVALLFALCHIVTAGVQGVLQRAYPPIELAGTPFFIVVFAQAIMLCLCSAIVPCYCYRRFLVDTRYSSESNSTGTVFRAGGLGIFAAGVTSLATLSPEQISTLLGNESLRSLPVLHVNYMAYLAFIRLLLFPAIGIATCYLSRKSK